MEEVSIIQGQMNSPYPYPFLQICINVVYVLFLALLPFLSLLSTLYKIHCWLYPNAFWVFYVWGAMASLTCHQLWFGLNHLENL